MLRNNQSSVFILFLGVPSTEATGIQLSLPTSATTSYFSSVSSTNVIRNRRQSVTAGFLLSDVNDLMGEWQVDSCSEIRKMCVNRLHWLLRI